MTEAAESEGVAAQAAAAEAAVAAAALVEEQIEAADADETAAEDSAAAEVAEAQGLEGGAAPAAERRKRCRAKMAPLERATPMDDADVAVAAACESQDEQARVEGVADGEEAEAGVAAEAAAEVEQDPELNKEQEQQEDEHNEGRQCEEPEQEELEAEATDVDGASAHSIGHKDSDAASRAASSMSGLSGQTLSLAGVGRIGVKVETVAANEEQDLFKHTALQNVLGHVDITQTGMDVPYHLRTHAEMQDFLETIMLVSAEKELTKKNWFGPV